MTVLDNGLLLSLKGSGCLEAANQDTSRDYRSWKQSQSKIAQLAFSKQLVKTTGPTPWNALKDPFGNHCIKPYDQDKVDCDPDS